MTWALLPSGAAVKGGNIVPKSGTNPWPTFWGTDWDWTWVKLQVDSAIALGCNAVRVIGSVPVVLDGTITRATYLSRWAQLADYCAANRLGLYLTGGDDVGSHSYTEVVGELVALASYMTAWPCVFAMDVLQERISWATTGTQGKDALAALRAVTTLPLTFSIGHPTGVNILAGTDTTTIPSIHSLTWSVDYIDLHGYSDPAATGLDKVWQQAPYMRVLFGEFGANQTETTAARAARYTAFKTAAAYTAGQARCAGCVAWALNDQGASAANQWGMFDTSGVERTDMSAVFRTFPTALATAPDPAPIFAGSPAGPRSATT